MSDQGSVRHLVFDTPAAAAIEAVTRVYGTPPTRGRNEECGAGPLDMASWPSGLTLFTQHGRFVGWSASRAAGAEKPEAITTLAGIGPGSTRSELESVYTAKVQQTTLGQEFEAGGLFGVLDGAGPKARISAMWGGTSCNFR